MSDKELEILNDLVALGLKVRSVRTLERLSERMMILTTPRQSFIFWTGLHDGYQTTVTGVDDPTDLIDHVLAEGWTETTNEDTIKLKMNEHLSNLYDTARGRYTEACDQRGEVAPETIGACIGEDGIITLVNPANGDELAHYRFDEVTYKIVEEIEA